MSDYQKGAIAKDFWVALLIVIVVGGAALLYVNRQHKINDLNKQVATLHSQITQLNDSKTKAQSISGQNVYYSDKGIKIIVYQPSQNATIASPVAVVGEVPGSWSFEGSFPVKLEDASGKIVASGTAQLLGDWMTSQLVPFSAKLTYSQTASGSGKLVLQKDNPSGLPANDDSVSLPVSFKTL